MDKNVCAKCNGKEKILCPWCKGTGCRMCMGKGVFQCDCAKVKSKVDVDI